MGVIKLKIVVNSKECRKLVKIVIIINYKFRCNLILVVS